MRKIATTRLRVGAVWRWDGALCFFLALQPVIVPGVASAQSQSIRPDGRTQTTVATQGVVTTVTTATVRSANAFNSFQTFNVPQGNTTNLILPSGTLNLINLVRDERTNIDGILNAIKDGRIGGNVWFANPHGLIVGRTGVVNVGSLNVSTPTQAFVDGFFLAPGTPNEAAVAQLLAGTAPRSGTGLISIQGQVNAMDGVNLSAGAINVAGSIYSGARFVGTAPDFTDVVNANGLASATNVVVREGRIQIVADNDVTVSGTIAAPGGSGVKGGAIEVKAGGNVALNAGASVVAHGNGEDSGGGTVHIQADNDAVTRAGALVDASAGTRGDGGSVEFSARKTVELAGGEFRADGTGGGRGGSVLIDPAAVIVSANILRGTGSFASGGGIGVSGANLTVQADETITVNPNVVISTRTVATPASVAAHETGDSTGSSGNITFQASEISLLNGAKLLAHVQNCVSCAAGDILLEATATGGNLTLADVESRVSMSNTMLKGRDVTLRATSTYATTVLPVVVKTVKAIIDVDSSHVEASGNLRMEAAATVNSTTPTLLPFGAIDATSEAAVNVRGSSAVISGGNATLAATSTVTATVVADMPNVVTLPVDAGVAVVLVDSKATVDVGGTSTLNVGGALGLSATNTVTVDATADASPGGSTAIGGTLALAVVDTTTRAAIGGSAAVTQAGSINVAAVSTNTINASAKAAAGGASDEGTDSGGNQNSQTQQALSDYQSEASTSDGGVQVAAAVVVVDLDSTTQAYLASTNTATASGAVSVSSRALNQSTIEADGSTSGGGVGVGAAVAVNVAKIVNEAYVAQTVSAPSLTVEALMADASENHKFSATATSGAGASDVGVAGSVAVNIVENRTKALITGAGTVNAGGDVLVASENRSELTAEAKPADGGATGDSVGIGASVAINVATSETRSAIENGARVNGATNITVEATGEHTVTTTAEAGAEGGVGLTPVAAISVVDNHTTARVGTGDPITLSGTLSVTATHSGTTTASATSEVAGENVAIGASVSVNVVSDAATATVARPVTSTGGGIIIAAVSDSTSTATAKASAKGGKGDEEDGGANDAPDDGVDQEVNKQKSAGTDKQAAGSANENQEASSAESSEGKVSVAAAVAVNVVKSRSEASLDAGGQTVSANGALSVTASNNTDAKAEADGTTSGESQVGIGAGVAINTVTVQSVASIGGGTIRAEGITVRSAMTDVSGDATNTFETSATSGAGGTKVGIAGSLALNIIDVSSTATINAGTAVNADGTDAGTAGGDVEIAAASSTSAKAEAQPDDTGASGGKVGVGASVAINTFSVDLTRASIGANASVSNAANVTVSATSDTDTEATAKAGASGSVALDAVVALSLVKQTSEATIASGGTIMASGAVNVSASATGDHTATATGDTEASSVAIGASAAVIVSDTSTKAAIERDITAGGALILAASAERTYEAVGKASAKGAKSDDESTQQEKDKATSTKTLKDNQSSQEGTEKTGSSSKLNVAAAAGVSVIDDDVEASIATNRTLQSAGNIELTATNTSDFSSRGLADAVDPTQSDVGIAFGAGLSIVRNDTTAAIGAGTHILSAADITVRAESTQNRSSGFVNKLAAEGVSGAGAKKAAIAGALAIANSDSTTHASIGDGVIVDQAGAMTIQADNTSKLAAKAWSGAISEKAGVGASVAIVLSRNEYKAWLGDNADVTADSLLISAKNHKVTGTVPFTFEFSLDGLTSDDFATKLSESNLQVLLGENNYYTEALAGAGGGQVAITGAFAVNVFDDTTAAFAGQGARVASTGTVSLTARNDTTAKAFAGALAVGRNAGVGLNTADIINESTTSAYLANDAQILQSSGVSLTAAASMDFGVFGASLGLANTAGIAGVATVIVSDNEVAAYTGTDASIVSSGNATLAAENSYKSLTVAGGAGGGGTAGVGASAAVNVVNSKTRAEIGAGSAVDAAGTTSVGATATEDIKTIVVAGAAGGTVGVGAGVSVNIINPETTATIGAGAQVNVGAPGQNVLVSAADDTTLFAIAGGIGAAGTAGIGAGVDVGLLTKNVGASIQGGSSDVRAAQNVKVTASSTEDIFSIGAAAGLAGTAAISGAATGYSLETVTRASIEGGATVHSGGNVVVAAESETDLSIIAGGLAVGGTVGIGASVAVLVTDKTTEAYIGAGANVTALGNGTAGADVASGQFNIGFTPYNPANSDEQIQAPSSANMDAEAVSAGGDLLTKQRLATPGTTNVRGLAVTATSQDDIKTFTVAGAVGGAVGVSLGANVLVMSSDVAAYIGDGAHVNQNNTGAHAAQTVLVAAGNDTYHLGISGSASAGGAVGAGAGAEVAIMDYTTTAAIGASATVNARRNVEVVANATQDIVAVAASAAAGGTVGLAGSVGVTVLDSETKASIGNGAFVDTDGNVRVAATDETDFVMAAGSIGVGFGAAGIGVAVGVMSMTKDTAAYIDNNGTVNARGGAGGAAATDMLVYTGENFTEQTAARGLAVEASSRENMTVIAAAGGAGLFAGVAGAVSVETVESTTSAYIGANADINVSNTGASTSQDVNVTARNDSRLLVVDGSVGIGAVGVAGSVDVGMIKNNTAAWIGAGAEVHANRDVDVHALSRKDIDSFVVSAAGGIVGIAAGVGVYSVGTALDQDSRSRLTPDAGGDSANGIADDQASSGEATGMLADFGNSDLSGIGAQTQARRSGLSFSSDLTSTPPAGNSVAIHANAQIHAGRHVDLDARETISFDLTTGAVAGGLVGLGAGIGIGNFNSNNTVTIGSGVSITAAKRLAEGDVTATARLDSNVNGEAYAGAAGLAAADAALTVFSDTSTVSVDVGDNVRILKADQARFEAIDRRGLSADASGASVGAFAVGASVATADVGGTVSATLGDGMRVGQGADTVGGLAVVADSASTAHSSSLAAKAGLGLAASGSVATSTNDATVEASIGDNALITTQGLTSVAAVAAPSAQAEAIGINVSLGASVGASLAIARSSPTITASLGTGSGVTAAQLDVLATRDVGPAPSAVARATGASGGLLLGANATVATAESTGATSALVGANSTLAVSGTTTVSASSESLQASSGEGFSFGLIALGADYSRANSNTLTQAVLGDGVKVTGNTLQVLATSEDTNYAYGLAGSGGLVSAPFSEATTSSISQTYARTGSGNNTSGNARKIDVSSLLVAASHDARFDSWMDSTNASLIGVSGAQVTNSANARSEAHIGTGGYVEADNITMQAHNDVLKAGPASPLIPGLSQAVPAWNVNSSSGGLADFPAAGSTTTIVTNALVQVGAGAHLEQTGNRNAPGVFVLDAWNSVVATDKVKMSSGGAISAAAGESFIFADVNNATVRVGDFAELASVGDIALGARAVADLFTQTAVDVYGLVGVAPSGDSVSRFQALNTIDIGAATFESLRDIKLSAGANTSEAANDLRATARTDVYNNTAIPVNRDPVADAIIGSHSQINIANGADVGAVRHVTLFAEKGAATASGVGIGKDIYREILAAIASAISNAFGGGDVSFETRTGRSIKNQTSDVTVNGDVRVGLHRKQELVIGLNGTATTQTDGIAIIDTGFKSIAADILDRINTLNNLIRQYSTNNGGTDASIAVAAWQTEIRFLERKLDELGFPRNGQPGFSGVAGISPRQAAQDAVNGMTATRSGYTTTRTNLTNDNTTLTTQNTTLTTQNTTLTTQNTTLTTQNTTLTTTNATLQGQLNGLPANDPGRVTLQNQINANNATIASNNTTIGNNTTTINNNTTTISNNTTTINNNTTQITQLTGQIDGLTTQITNVQADINNNVYSNAAAQGPVATFLTVGDSLAQLGNIFVRGDRLRGSGTLDAPGDAEIKITNNGPNFLVLKNLTIPPDDGGKIYLNNIEVKDNVQINGINGAAAGAAFTIFTAESQINSSGQPVTPGKPRIIIESKFDPLNPAHAAALEGLNQTQGTDIPALAPDIILQGDVSNLRGLVKIDSAAGSIRLEQKRDNNGVLIQPVSTATVRADDVEIKTRNGDFVQSYTDTFFHTAGAPLTTTNGQSNLAFPGNIDRITRTPEAAGAGIIANGSVLIAARYLNINGTIQSGISEWGVRVPSSATVTIPGLGNGSFAQAQAHYNGLTPAQRAVAGAEFYDVSGATVAGLSGNVQGNWEKIGVSYNARENRLELSGVRVQGGYIELFGQIFNTNQNGGGQLRVMDGYGQIKVDNQTSLPMWVNVLDTGRGVAGEINITNISGLDSNGAPVVTTTNYTRTPGGARSGTSYNPQTDLRYRMTVGYDSSREDFYRYSQSGWFNISSTFSSLALDQYRLNSIQRSNDPMSRGEFLQVQPGIATHYSPTQSATYGAGAITNPTGGIQTQTTSSVLTPGSSWRDCNWWTLCANATYYQEFTVTTGTKTTIMDSVKADYAIPITYIGFDQGTVNVASAGNVVLNAAVNNRNGNTTVTSTGSIKQNGDLPILGGNNVTLNAGTGIGGPAQSLLVNVKDGGKLDATSNSGEVRVAQVVGDLKVGTVGGAGVSNVVLEAERNLLGFNASSYVQGQRVELLARNGGIGELNGVNNPLTVRTGYTTNQSQWPNNGLMATARDTINIKNVADPLNASTYSGNLLLISAESLAGDVRIETTGKVIDNNPFATTDLRTQQELADLWDALRLRGPLAVTKANEAVASFENGKTSSYQLYWQIRQRQANPATYDAGFQYTVSQAENDALVASGMNGAQIQQFAANRTAQYHQLHAEVGGFTAAFNAGFRYDATPAEETQIRQGSSWTDAQLALSVGAGLLKNITDTVTTIKEPNAKGRSITLIASSDVGSFNDPLVIDLSAGLNALTTEQKAALAAAERGDATLAGNLITIIQPRPVNVTTGTGALNATTGGLAFLGSEQDLRIDNITAAGDVRVKTAGSLVNAASTPGAANIVGGSMILEAANGGIGSVPDSTGAVSTPLRVTTAGGAGIIARAASDIWIEGTQDLAVDTMFSRNNLLLNAVGSILDFHASESSITPDLNLRSNNMTLTAQTGSIGTPLNPLDAGVNPNGLITATAATLGQGVYLNGPAGESFNIGSVTSGDAIALSSATGMKIDGPVTGPGAIQLVAGADIAMTPNAAVHATTLGLFLDAGTLTMADGASMTVDVGTVDIRTVGDAVITGISTGNPTASAISIVSTAGHILDGGDSLLDIIADTPPAAKLTISGALGVGADPLDVRLLNLNATSGGVVDLAVQNSVTIEAIQAADRVLLTAGGSIVNGGTVTGSSVILSAPDSITGGTINVGSNLQLSSNTINTIVNGGPGVVGGSVTGPNGGIASNVNLTLSNPSGFAFSSFQTAQGTVNIPTGSFSFQNGIVVDRATFTNPDTTVLVDQHNRALQPFDVQLYTGGASFSFSLLTNHVSTNSPVINYGPMHEVLTPNGPSISAVDQGYRALTEAGTPSPAAPQEAQEQVGELITFTGIPVALEE